MSDLYIAWPDYHQAIEQLSTQIYQSQWSFNQIICIARGGLRIGDVLSRIYDVPLAILSTCSYHGQEQGHLSIAQHLTMSTPRLGDQVLLVDDLVDSGVTLQQTVLWLKKQYGQDIQAIRTAVLWYKAASVYQPDYYVSFLAHNPWIHQPFEVYESLSPQALATQSADLIPEC